MTTPPKSGIYKETKENNDLVYVKVSVVEEEDCFFAELYMHEKDYTEGGMCTADLAPDEWKVYVDELGLEWIAPLPESRWI